MKTYLIGRDDMCRIRIVDPTNTVSRKHATLNVHGLKMTITDHSSNGTYINNIKIMPNTPVPVTRKDIISFANAAELDWSVVPNPLTKILAVSGGIVALIVAIIVCLFVFPKNEPDPEPGPVVINTQDLKENVNNLKTTVKQLEEQFNTLKERCNKASEVLDRKEGGKKRDAVLKKLAPIQQGLESMDFSKTNRAIERLEEDIADVRPQERINEKIAQLSKELSDKRGAMQNYSEKLNDVENEVKTLADKKAPKPDTQKEEKKETKDTTILSPNITRTF